MSLRSEIEMGYALGWSFTPLLGKRPTLTAWQSRPRETLEEALAWTKQGNVGLRTGANSGVYVVDVDIEKGAEMPNLPETITAARGKNRHFYFVYQAGLGNTSGRLGPHIDTRGDGGQVVYPGSVHPDTGDCYIWEKSPKNVALAELPGWIVEALKTKPTKPVKPPKPLTGRCTRYARTALTTECKQVREATEGTRNATLNTAAFNMGQLIGGDDIDRESVENELTQAALAAGLDESEVRSTIRSGIAGGLAKPRTARRNPAKKRSESQTEVSVSDASTLEKTGILVPGSHLTRDGELFDVGTDDFANSVLARLPIDSVYRRGGIAGELVGEQGKRHFEPLTVDRLRIIIDSHMSLIRWKTYQDEAKCFYQPCTRDQGGLVLAHASISAPDLKMIVNYPVYGPLWERLSPGYNDGIYYDQPAELVDLTPETNVETIVEMLEELTVDFPFADSASRENFNGLLLTPIIRPALNGNTPFHLINSSMERTGKSKMIEEVLGEVILGYPTPAIQLNGTDEERDKRILSLLARGTTIVHLDNLPPFIDSAALASLLTSKTYSGRVLGASKIIDLTNNLTVVGSGNNVTTTSELAKRTIPILLQPSSDSPETRTNFKHPDIRSYIKSVRRHVLACLLGAIEIWIEKGKPPHRDRMGGFEAWSESIGSILRGITYSEWRKNTLEWRRNADPQGEELQLFVEAWWNEHRTLPVDVAKLAQLARNENILRDSYRSSERGFQVSFGMRVLRPLINRPIGRWTVRKMAIRESHNRYCLELRDGEDTETNTDHDSAAEGLFE